MPPSLGFLLALPPEDPRTARALEFLDHQHHLQPYPRIYVYCLADGVKTLSTPKLQELRREGLRLLACAQSARQHQISPRDQATFGGLGLLVDLLAAVDTFRSVGPGSPLDWRPAPPPALPSPPVSHREVVVTALDSQPDSPRTVDALRVAAGLSAGGQLPVTLAISPTMARAWAEAGRTAADPEILEHLQLFHCHGGQIITPDRPMTPPPPAHAAIAEPLALPPSEWGARLKRAFALLPL